MAEERTGDRLIQMDKEVRKWANLTRKDLLIRLNSLSLEERSRLAGELSLRESLKTNLRKRNGDIESVGFSFVRHGIFLEHGVGRGRPVGSPQANDAKKPWIKPVLSESIETLADLLEKEYADIAAAELKLFVPGIIDTRIS